MAEVGEIGWQNGLEHFGQGKQEVLDAYQLNLQTLRKFGLPSEEISGIDERMQRVISAPELAEVIRPATNKAVFVHSTESEIAKKIFQTGLFADSLIGIADIVIPLESIGEGMTPEMRKKAIQTNLETLTSLGRDGGGISGEAKIIIELPPPPKFGKEGEPLETEYGFDDWTSQYIKPHEIMQGRRHGSVSDSILPPKYIIGYIDFKERKFVRNPYFGFDDIPQALPGLYPELPQPAKKA